MSQLASQKIKQGITFESTRKLRRPDNDGDSVVLLDENNDDEEIKEKYVNGGFQFSCLMQYSFIIIKCFIFLIFFRSQNNAEGNVNENDSARKPNLSKESGYNSEEIHEVVKKNVEDEVRLSINDKNISDEKEKENDKNEIIDEIVNEKDISVEDKNDEIISEDKIDENSINEKEEIADEKLPENCSSVASDVVILDNEISNEVSEARESVSSHMETSEEMLPPKPKPRITRTKAKNNQQNDEIITLEKANSEPELINDKSETEDKSYSISKELSPKPRSTRTKTLNRQNSDKNLHEQSKIDKVIETEPKESLSDSEMNVELRLSSIENDEIEIVNEESTKTNIISTDENKEENLETTSKARSTRTKKQINQEMERPTRSTRTKQRQIKDNEDEELIKSSQSNIEITDKVCMSEKPVLRVTRSKVKQPQLPSQSPSKTKRQDNELQSPSKVENKDSLSKITGNAHLHTEKKSSPVKVNRNLQMYTPDEKGGRILPKIFSQSPSSKMSHNKFSRLPNTNNSTLGSSGRVTPKQFTRITPGCFTPSEHRTNKVNRVSEIFLAIFWVIYISCMN